MDLIPRGFGFNDFFDTFLPERHVDRPHMKCDIYEKDGEYNLIMDIPGFKKEDVKIESEDGYLTITATKEDISEDNDVNYIRKERHYGTYQRSFYVGEIDPENIDAEFKDGSLIVKFPKEDAKSTKKEIEIKG